MGRAPPLGEYTEDFPPERAVCTVYEVGQGGGLTTEGRGRRELVQLAAVEKFEQRAPVADIVAELRVSERSVRRWRRVWEAGGVRGLSSKGQAAQCQLDDDQLAELDRVLDAGPAASGREDRRWTLVRIRDLAAREFGVRYTAVPVIWYLLRRRGWNWQLGARRAIERDDGAIEVWKATRPRVKDRGGPRRLDRFEDQTGQSQRPP